MALKNARKPGLTKLISDIEICPWALDYRSRGMNGTRKELRKEITFEYFMLPTRFFAPAGRACDLQNFK